MSVGIQDPDASKVPSSSKTFSNSQVDTIPAITAIVPAYNEANTIGGVLGVLRQVKSLAEILVVDDGSTDDTSGVAWRVGQEDRRIHIIRHTSNRGKGQAVFTGWNSARSPILLLLDADLNGLTPQHVQALFQPVVKNRVDMTLGLFRGGRWNTDLAHILTPWLTGQRCLRADLIKYINLRAAAGYGLETVLTVASRQYGWRTEEIILRGVSHPIGETHRGFWRGSLNRIRMYGNIVAAWFLAGGLDGKKERGRHVRVAKHEDSLWSG